MSKPFADITLGLNPQATAVLHLLSSYDVDFVSKPEQVQIKTAAWYNGRERGYVITVQLVPGSVKTLVIAWAEAKSSDALMVYAWESDLFFMNPPTVNDIPEEVWCEGSTAFPCEASGTAADFIYRKIEKFIKSEVKNQAA